MFYKLVVNKTPVLYNLAIVKRIKLVKNQLFMYYKYTGVAGNALVFFSNMCEDHTVITFDTEDVAKEHFENIEQLLK